MLKRCASISSSEHGDARRAIDLLRTSGEIAVLENKKVTTSYVDSAIKQLQKNQITVMISGGSHHFRLACAALIRITFLSGKGWHVPLNCITNTKKLYQKNPMKYLIGDSPNY